MRAGAPGSADSHFDDAGSRADHNRSMVEVLWARGIGCARYDLIAPSARVLPVHPAAFGRHVDRGADVLERLHRIDPAAEVTLVAMGDGVDVAFALARTADRRPPGEPRPWPVVRSLLALAPVKAADEAALARKARDLAGIVARDERRSPISRAVPVTRRVLRRLGW